MEELEFQQKQLKSYSLKEISKWQGEVSREESNITLPSLQRGFVWKAHQIENLWDSILRGYPIGSILISKSESGNKQLLDGQQRCTSVALGFYDPFEINTKKEFLSLKDYLPSVWIDLKPVNKLNDRKFVVRVLTKSHPWGYQIQREKNGNGKTLSMTQRREAKIYFDKKSQNKNYIDLLSNEINPWEANCPIPLSFLLNIKSLDKDEFIKEVRKKLENLEVQTQFSNKENIDYKKLEDSDFDFVFKGIQSAKITLIPEILVGAELLKNDEDDMNMEQQDPTLFVRLNSAGTQITGEELIYSIYKALFPTAKELVESIGATYLAPSKVINLISRLVNCELNVYSSFPSDYNPNTFRKAIANEAFVEKLKSYISEGENSKLKKIIDLAILILKQKKEDMPPVLIKQFVASNTDLFLVLLLFIKKNNLSEQTITESQIKDISGNYTYLLWFNNDKNKISSRFFKQLFNESNSTWKNATLNLIQENLIFPLISPELARKQLLEILNKGANYNDNSITLDVEVKNEISPDKSESGIELETLRLIWSGFIWKIKDNKSLLLYAQREYLNKKFKDFNQFDPLEDTNRPWDWDHIYPNSWVYKNKGISQMVRNWVNCIGNFRALSYDENREQKDNSSPEERFKGKTEVQKDSFISENDLLFWLKLDDSCRKIKYNDNELVDNFIGAVINRMMNIYADWHENYYNYKN